MTEPSYYELWLKIKQQHVEDKLQVQPPCSGGNLDALKARARQELKTEVPGAYLAFLSVADGLDWDGLVIYASHTTPVAGNPKYSIQGFVDANLDWWDYAPNRHFLFYGESGDDLYVFDRTRNAHQIIERQSQRLIEVFGSFDDLMAAAFRSHVDTLE